MKHRRKILAKHLHGDARGFTLIEASLTTVIVGVGFMALLQVVATGTATNLKGAETTAGVNLARNVRELTLKMPFSELAGLNGQINNPPVDSRGQALSDFSTWTQKVTVQPVDPDRMTLNVNDADPSAERITVQILHNGTSVCSVSWYAFDGTP